MIPTTIRQGNKNEQIFTSNKEKLGRKITSENFLIEKFFQDVKVLRNSVISKLKYKQTVGKLGCDCSLCIDKQIILYNDGLMWQ